MSQKSEKFSSKEIELISAMSDQDVEEIFQEWALAPSEKYLLPGCYKVEEQKEF